MHPNYVVKKPKLLYIDRYGYIYPDCKTYLSPVIGHICDEDITNSILKKIFLKNEEPVFNMVTVEFSSLCHAKCFYCFQEDGRRGEKYLYFDLLMDLLEKINTYWLFFSGGEILDQADAMQFISDYRKKKSDTWIHLKTNGNANLSKIDFIDHCCDSIMVSFNGFSKPTCETLMCADIDKTIAFCENVKRKTNTNLGVKFLNSPVCIAELPDFLEWALHINAKAIVLQTVYQYSFEQEGKSIRQESVFYGLSNEYWNHIFSRVSKRTEAVINNYFEFLNSGTRYLSADKKTFEVLQLSYDIQKTFRTDGVYIIE